MSKPWMKFYPADFQADPAVRSCSLAARGLWVEMLCLMQKSEPIGHLLVNGKQPSASQLATLCGASKSQVERGISELEAAGVFSRADAGVIYSRRMVRDERKIAEAKENGSKGGNPALKGGDNQGVNPQDKAGVGEGVKAQKPEARNQKEVSAQARDLAKRIWDASPSPARRRSNLPAVERATEAAINDGGEPDIIERAVRAYFESDDATKDDGRYARAVHRVLQNGGWREWIVNAPGHDSRETSADWERRLEAFHGKDRVWIESLWGPSPGREGCRVPADLLERVK